MAAKSHREIEVCRSMARGPGILAAGALIALAVGLAAPAGSVEVMSLWSDWVLIERSCSPPSPPDAYAVPCGELGTYVFFSEPLPFACTPTDGGVVDDDFYIEPRQVMSLPATPYQVPGVRIAGPLPAKVQASSPTSPLPPPPPPPPPPPEPTTPPKRVVLIDWDDHHGATMQGIVEQLGGDLVTAEVLALDDPELVESLGLGIGDGHVIANLCRIAEELDITGGVPAPAVVSMSFGRWSTDDLDAETCAGSLACHVARIVEHIRATWGTVLVASAGNHGDLLFPARLRSVRSIGAFDLSYFAAHGVAIPSWETPEGPGAPVDILLPGDGVCVGGKDTPAGSSNATAAAAGYLAVRAHEGVTLEPGVGTWKPSYSPSAACYLMGSSVSLVSGCVDAFDHLMAQVVSGTCTDSHGGAGSTDPTEPPLVRTVTLSTQGEAQPDVPSLVRWRAENHGPSPGTDICLPCLGGGGESGGGPSSLLAGSERRAKLVAVPTPGADIAIDLSGSAPLDDRIRIVELFLRVGDAFYRASATPRTLLELEGGLIDVLILEDALDLILADEQPSFFVRGWVDIDDNGQVDIREEFWDSSPIFIP